MPAMRVYSTQRSRSARTSTSQSAPANVRNSRRFTSPSPNQYAAGDPPQLSSPTELSAQDGGDDRHGAMRLRPYWECALRVPAVAVLVLLAAAAGAVLVAADLAPTGGVFRVALLCGSGLSGHQRRIGEGHLVL